MNRSNNVNFKTFKIQKFCAEIQLKMMFLRLNVYEQDPEKF